jgi:hypothetical protein
LKTRLQDRFTRVDLAALLAFVAVWIFYGVMVRYSAYVADECAYISIAERFVLGDRPIVDEWNLAQMSCLILCLPYKLFVAVTGGTAGVVLFLRYVFLAFNAAFFWFVYIRLRAYKWVGLIAALLFSIYVPLGLFSCNFYTVAIRFVMIACLILFSEKQKLPSLILAGVLLAWSALFQPGFALLYFIYTALAWIRFFRQKKSKPFLDDVSFCFTMRAWIGITLGVLLSAAAVLIWLIASCGVQSIVASVPLLFTEPAFDVSADGNVKGFFLRKIVSAAQIYTPVCWIPALVILALSIAYACGKFGARRDNMRKVLFGLGCVIWLLSCILPLCQAGRLHLELLFTMYPMPMFWFGFVCYLLGDKGSKRLLFFWVARQSDRVYRRPGLFHRSRPATAHGTRRRKGQKRGADAVPQKSRTRRPHRPRPVESDLRRLCGLVCVHALLLEHVLPRASHHERSAVLVPRPVRGRPLPRHSLPRKLRQILRRQACGYRHAQRETSEEYVRLRRGAGAVPVRAAAVCDLFVLHVPQDDGSDPASYAVLEFVSRPSAGVHLYPV